MRLLTQTERLHADHHEALDNQFVADIAVLVPRPVKIYGYGHTITTTEKGQIKQ